MNYVIITSTCKSIYETLSKSNLKAWHSGRFGKSVQHSCLGTLKRKLIENNAYVIPRSRKLHYRGLTPSTKLCPFCGNRVDIPLSDRVFKCSCGYTEDRDVKAAKTILIYGKYSKLNGINDSSLSFNKLASTELNRFDEVYDTGTQADSSKNQIHASKYEWEGMQDFVEYAKYYARKQFSMNPEAPTL